MKKTSKAGIGIFAVLALVLALPCVSQGSQSAGSVAADTLAASSSSEQARAGLYMTYPSNAGFEILRSGNVNHGRHYGRTHRSTHTPSGDEDGEDGSDNSHTVPEPNTLLLLGAALVSTALLRRRRE